MWTLELQKRQLGDGYAVGSTPGLSRGPLHRQAAPSWRESLRKRVYPRQIYVANSAPFTPPAPYGTLEPYRRYMFWEARAAAGVLRAFSFRPRDALVSDYESEHMAWGERFGIWGREWLDRALRFRDLWNWVGYTHFFTIENARTPHMMQAVWPRRDFDDQEPDFEDTPVDDRFRPSYNDAIEMKITRAFSGHFFFKDWKGNWRPDPAPARVDFEDNFARGAVPGRSQAAHP